MELGTHAIRNHTTSVRRSRSCRSYHMTEPTLSPKPTPAPRRNQTAAIPTWVSLVVLVGALLTAIGAVIALVNPAMLAAPHIEINGAVHIYAGYLAARNFALAFMLVALLLL